MRDWPEGESWCACLKAWVAGRWWVWVLNCQRKAGFKLQGFAALAKECQMLQMQMRCARRTKRGVSFILDLLKPRWAAILELSLVGAEMQPSVSDSSWYLKASTSIPGHGGAAGCAWTAWSGTAGDFSLVFRQSFCGRIQYPDGSEVEYLPSSWQAWDRYFLREEKVLLQVSLRTSMHKSIHASVWRRVISPEQAQTTS